MKSKKGMYFVTLISWLVVANRTTDKRCIGYYKKLEDAVSVVESDPTLGDPYWNYAVIEEITPGAYSTNAKDSSIWYKLTFNKKRDRYVIKRVKCPKQYKQICNWGVG